MTVNVLTRRHRELSKKQLTEIALLKDQHWPHGVDSQKTWIARNFEDDDVHIILYQQETPVAYASLNRIRCGMDSREETFWGLGGVCVAKDRQKQGLGKKMVACANQFIAASKLPGLLLCHRELTGFYGVCGWEVLRCEQVTVAETAFSHFVMSFGSEYRNAQILSIPKNF